jgi:adenylate cyclase
VMNIGAVTTIVLALINYFVRQKNLAYKLLSVEQQKSERLLLNILPKEIAAILKNENRTIADNYAEASILFADLVGFTPLTAQMSPAEMVNLLNHIFSYFDSLVEKYSLEKIRTIGDNYMVAAGVPRIRSDHALALAKMALEMRDFIYSLPPVSGRQIQFRIGINSGAVVGGVIGRKKFVYDLWGDAVNIASRMESHGIAGAIQITQSTYELICSECICEPRGAVEIKGKGEMQTWFLTGLKSTAPAAGLTTPESRSVPAVASS